MADPPPDELRSTLARLLGWKFSATRHGIPAVVSPDGHECDPLNLPDPENDLNAMRTVEAALGEQGLADEYVAALWDGVGAERDSRFWTERVFRGVFACITAPAAVRALAAYQVLIEAKG